MIYVQMYSFVLKKEEDSLFSYVNPLRFLPLFVLLVLRRLALLLALLFLLLAVLLLLLP